MLHRFGMRAQPLLLMKFGRSFVLDDAAVTELENITSERPYTDTSLGRNKERTVLWVEPFYWSLRLAIQKSLDTEVKADAVSKWIKSGDWDRTRKTTAKKDT
jgi:hypothetical protein